MGVQYNRGQLMIKGGFKERNEKIRLLSKEGRYTQLEIGKIYGLTQPRVNRIILEKNAAYRYCFYCKTHVKTARVCDSCRQKRLKEKEEAELQKNIDFCTETLYLLEEKKIAREKRLTPSLALRGRIWLSMARKKLIYTLRRVATPHASPEAKKDPIEIIFPWQKQGRDRVRFLVRHRDKNTCQDCYTSKSPFEVAEQNKKKPRSVKSLDVHHLNGLCGKKTKGYDSVKEMGNMITLCHSCHFRRHDFRKRLDGRWKEYSSTLSPSSKEPHPLH